MFDRAALCNGDKEDPFDTVRGLWGFELVVSPSSRIVLSVKRLRLGEGGRSPLRLLVLVSTSCLSRPALRVFAPALLPTLEGSVMSVGDEDERERRRRRRLTGLCAGSSARCAAAEAELAFSVSSNPAGVGE